MKRGVTVFIILIICLGFIYLFFQSKNEQISFHKNILEKNGKFEIKNDGVYFVDELIKGVDKATFRILDGSYYAIDKYHVYFKNRIVKGADPESFEIIVVDPKWLVRGGASAAEYARDKINVYWNGFVLENADSKTFKQISALSFEDKNCYYRFNNIVDRYCDKRISTDGSPVAKHFIEDDDFFGSDYIFYIPRLDYIKSRGINNIDYMYGTDGKYVYELYSGTIVDNLSLEDTKILTSNYWTVPRLSTVYGKVPVVYDNEDVYWVDNTNNNDELAPKLVEMKNVDRQTFRILTGYTGYSYDKNHLYYEGKEIQSF